MFPLRKYRKRKGYQDENGETTKITKVYLRRKEIFEDVSPMKPNVPQMN